MSTRSRANLTSTLPDLIPQAFPGFGENAPLDLPAVDEATAQQIGDLLTSPGFDAWSEALARVGNCSLRASLSAFFGWASS